MRGGKSSAPTNAGSYNVVATLSSQTSYGNANGTLIVNPAAATVALANLMQAADGKPKTVSATSVPAGLPKKAPFGRLSHKPST